MIVSVAERLKNVEEYYFSKKLEQIQHMRSRGVDVINLGIGSPDLVPPAPAIEALMTTMNQPGAHSYSSYRSTPELRKAMAEWYRQTYQVELDPAREVLPLLGSKEGMFYLSMALLNPGDSVLVPNPGYPAYAAVAALLGARVIYYDLTEENGWMPDLEALEASELERCKLMWVNYPHMPTGQACDSSFFSRLIAFAQRKKILVCNDNPYGLVLNTRPPQSILSADPKMTACCELNSMSKSFNMAGWRVGMFLGAAELVDAVLRVKSNVDSGMFVGVQKGAIAAFGVEQSWHEERNEIYRRRRKIVWEIFDQLGFEYSREQVGLFVWAKAPAAIPDVACYLDEVLEQAHVFITPGMIFGSNGRNYARASLCATEEVFERALVRICAWKKGESR